MSHVPQTHPEVVSLLQQLQAQHGTIGNVSSFVAFVTIMRLRRELYRLGWNTRLADDEITVVLFPVESEAPDAQQ